jgi:GT2 family glycosyltransferase
MVKALEENPDCDLCDTLLRLIDGNDQEICENTPTYIPHFWHTDFPRDRKHIRRPPYDFFQHFCGKTVYTSITQLLIRRTLFEKTGLFDPSFGRSTDFLWGLRAARHASVIFLPEKLASWRIHADQVTSADDPAEVDKAFRQMSAMARCAIAEEKVPAVREKALFLYRIIPFKEMLLPAKRKRNFRYFLLSLLKAAFCHPLFLTAFAVEAFKCLKSSSRRTWLIKSYDHLALRRLRKLDLKNKYVEYK